MGIFRKLFGGSSSNGEKARAAKGAPGDRGIYFFVKPDGCDEIVRVRIDPMNDLTESDGGGFFVRKVASGVKCFKRVEMEFSFNNAKKVTDTQITGGVLVDEAAWRAWTAAQEQTD